MMHLSIVSIPVSDQERAKVFYRDVLGFQVVREQEIGPQAKWVHMRPPSGLAGITLVTWFESMPPGSAQGMVLETIDIERARSKLAANGLAVSDIQNVAWGQFATFSDPDGNGWVLSSAHRAGT